MSSNKFEVGGNSKGVLVYNYNIMTSDTKPKPFIISAPGVFFVEPWQLFDGSSKGVFNGNVDIRMDMLKVLVIKKIKFITGTLCPNLRIYVGEESADILVFKGNITSTTLIVDGLFIKARYLRVIIDDHSGQTNCTGLLIEEAYI